MRGRAEPGTEVLTTTHSESLIQALAGISHESYNQHRFPREQPSVGLGTRATVSLNQTGILAG